MRFIDEARVFVHAGKGGNGAIAFLREKYRPFGGPAGGDGGRGGSVIFEVNEGMSTLLDFKYQPRLIARDGESGRGKQQYGKAASDLIVRVPPGTVVIDDESGDILADLVMPNEQKVIAQGGEGGKGNIHFATSTRRSPRIATPGTAGEQRWVRLELRLVAEVGLVGLPNAGKSTLLRALTAARPKVASYPFTTITPNLGRVMISDEEAFSIADIPGLIEGAHLGQGLGIRFLRHVSRTSVLVYVLDASSTPAEDFRVVRGELEAFDPDLPARPSLIALNKMDLISRDDAKKIVREIEAATSLKVIAISAEKLAGLEPLVTAISTQLHNIEAQKPQEVEKQSFPVK
ncbi:MAG TPA: GTPase ObgE [Candidatus Binataceae bacterium]|nr:GTPase ObgE [Candidatus Binataceae bacterium]